MKRQLPLLVGLLIALHLLQACAWSQNDLAPPRELWNKGPYQRCDHGSGSYTVDFVMGGFSMLGAAAIINDSREEDIDGQKTSPLAALPMVLLATPFLWSAINGMSDVQECRSYQETMIQRPQQWGCFKDTDCKGDRICTNQDCQAPPSP